MSTLRAHAVREEPLSGHSASRVETGQALQSSQALQVARLRAEEQTEVLNFLAARPLHTVALSSMILDEGLVSPLHRGAFYGCRNAQGELEGVALIGHATLFEARSARAVKALALAAQSSTQTHLIMGEQEQVRDFWTSYAERGRTPRLAGRELLFEKRWPCVLSQEVEGLRLATLEDLELIVPVHAQMAFEESGVNPLDTDAEGFRSRCAHRLAKGRVWVWVEAGSLIFKADVVAETDACIYLEGIYLNPLKRGQGYGLRCLSQLSRQLLQRAGSLCLLVNEQNDKALNLYLRAGYKLRSVYETIFLS